MLLTIVLGTIAVIFLIFQWIQHWSPYARKLNAFPGPRILPIVGHILDLSSKTGETIYIYRYGVRFNYGYGTVRCDFYANPQYITTVFRNNKIWVAGHGTLHIITADDAEIILSSTKILDKALLYKVIHDWLGTGLLTSTGKKWQHRRKMLTPAFHFSILRRFVEVFGEHCNNFVKSLEVECEKPRTNIIPLITELTLRNICETAMGIKLNSDDEDQKNYTERIKRIVPLVTKRIMNPLIHLNFIYYYLSPDGRKYKQILKSLHPFTKKVIHLREENFNDANITDFENENSEEEISILVKKKKRLAMLDLLLSAKRNRGEIDDEGIREEVDTFVFEGHDTTTSAACSSLMLLANHKDVQEKIISELDEIFGDSKLPATYEDLQKMQYLDRCLKECLRICPAVPLIVRRILEDTKLTHHVAPAGTEVVIHILDIHRDPVYFPDPEKFDPDRFLPENSKGRHPYAYVPFSAGPRNCIGQKFAMLEVKSIVSSVFRNFTLEPIDNHDDLTFKIDFTLRTVGPIHVKFVKKN